MTRRAWVLSVVGILVAAAALRVVYVLMSSPVDDAYITFRYARNIAEGLGFVYNAGERVLGTTTPLFTLILVPVAWLSLPLDGAAMAISILAELATCAILMSLLARFVGREAGILAGLFYGLFYASASACGYGMESQLFQLLVTAAIWRAAEQRGSQAAILAGLAALTRPEGCLLAAILTVFVLIDWGRHRRPIPWKPFVLFLAVLAPWLIFATLYFGSPIPNSILAKVSKEGITVSTWAGFFFLRNPIVIILWCAAAFGLTIGVIRRSAPILLLGSWMAVYLIFFLVGRPPFMGVWYFAPVTAALVGLAAVAGASISAWLFRRRGRGVVAAAAVWIIVTGFILPRTIESARWWKQTADQVYRPMGHWTARNTDPGDIVQVADIGYVGYLSGRTILDSSGLISPETTDFFRKHAHDPLKDLRFVLREKPDLLLLPLVRNVYTRFTGGGLLDHYRPVARFQVQGAIALTPEQDPGPEYERARRFMADYIAYTPILGDGVRARGGRP